MKSNFKRLHDRAVGLIKSKVPVRWISVLPALMLLVGCQSGGNSHKESDSFLLDNNEAKSKQYDNKFNGAAFTYEISDAKDGSFGYRILADGKIVIDQQVVPGLPGLKGFDDRDAAVKVAELVISKLNNGIMPPTVTQDELAKLGLLR